MYVQQHIKPTQSLCSKTALHINITSTWKNKKGKSWKQEHRMRTFLVETFSKTFSVLFLVVSFSLFLFDFHWNTLKWKFHLCYQCCKSFELTWRYEKWHFILLYEHNIRYMHDRNSRKIPKVRINEKLSLWLENLYIFLYKICCLCVCFEVHYRCVYIFFLCIYNLYIKCKSIQEIKINWIAQNH